MADLPLPPAVLDDSRIAFRSRGSPADYGLLAAQAARAFGAPAAAVLRFEGGRVGAVASHGAVLDDPTRFSHFVRHALHRSGPLVVADTWRDPRFANGAAVRGPPRVRFWASARMACPPGDGTFVLAVWGPDPGSGAPGLEARLAELASGPAPAEATRPALDERAPSGAAAPQVAHKEAEAALWGLAHDLHSPLSALLGYLDLAREALDAGRSNDAALGLTRAGSCGRRLAGLVRELAHLARHHPVTGPGSGADAGECLGDAVENLNALLGAAGATVHATELPVVAIPPSALTRIFQNLLENAVRHRGDEEPRIEVFSERTNQGWVLSVRDNGSGVPEESRERIFLPHERGEGPGAGTGLGLAICSRLVGARGGRIWVESHAGEGSVFRFLVPDPVAA